LFHNSNLFGSCIIHILYTGRAKIKIYNSGVKYFKHGTYSPFFPFQNAVCFIILTYLVPVIFTFNIQGVLKLKEIIPASNILNMVYTLRFSSSKCSLFHNSNVFGFCIIHVLYTGCAKIKINNSGVKYFKHGIYCPFFALQNAVCFIILTYLVPVLFTFYIQGVLRLKEIIPALNILNMIYNLRFFLFKMQFVS
jgi:hypothetical protein